MSTQPDAALENLRADARRNRDAILASARLVFAERGYDAPLSAIAHHAGVGRATMQRRFPTRGVLALELALGSLDEVAELAAATSDNPASYFLLLEKVTQIVIRDRGSNEYLDRPDVPDSYRDLISDRLVEVTRAAFQKAQEAGLLRQDLVPTDTIVITEMLGGPIRHPVPYHNEVERTAATALELIGAAIRPTGTHRV